MLKYHFPIGNALFFMAFPDLGIFVEYMWLRSYNSVTVHNFTIMNCA